MPILFIIALDHALRFATNIHKEDNGLAITLRQSRQHSAVTVTDNNFADGILLISNAIQEGKMLLQGTEKEPNYSSLTVCFYHVTYAFESESTLYSCLIVKELLARNRREI